MSETLMAYSHCTESMECIGPKTGPISYCSSPIPCAAPGHVLSFSVQASAAAAALISHISCRQADAKLDAQKWAPESFQASTLGVVGVLNCL